MRMLQIFLASFGQGWGAVRRLNRATRRWLALLVWVFAILLFVGLGSWNISSSREDAENRLIGEAGRTAAQIAALLSLPGVRLDNGSIAAIVAAAMEDDRIYAVRIQTRGGLKDGRRRNYLWEPVSWDDEIADNCVQGMNPIRIGGQVEGKVDVWLSPRLNEEEDGLLAIREHVRFAIAAGGSTFVLLLLLWHWGDLAHWRSLVIARPGANQGERAYGIILGLGNAEKAQIAAEAAKKGPCFVDQKAARAFLSGNDESWAVIAGMFRQTFARAPGLISRLFSERELAGLCHLGRMLEQAAPCIGARPLSQAAKAMQVAVNNPECANKASSVEECVKVLEQTLAALTCSYPRMTEEGQTTAAPVQMPEQGQQES